MTPLSTKARRAIADCVRSVKELEILLTLARSGDQYGSAENIAAATGIPTRVVSAALERLALRGLLDVRVADVVRYKLDPAPAERRRQVQQVIAAATDDRAAVVRGILEDQQRRR